MLCNVMLIKQILKETRKIDNISFYAFIDLKQVGIKANKSMINANIFALYDVYIS